MQLDVRLPLMCENPRGQDVYNSELRDVALHDSRVDGYIEGSIVGQSRIVYNI